MPTSAVTVTAFTNFAITTGRAIADAAMLAETAPPLVTEAAYLLPRHMNMRHAALAVLLF